MSESILITGIGGPAGKSALTYFSSKGFSIIGTDIREVEIKADRFHLVPQAIDPSYIEVILKLIKKEKPSLFIPTVTEELFAVSKIKKEVEALGCAMYISPSRSVEIANDKLKTALFMRDHGVPVPVTFDESAPREFIMRELGLPLLAKPTFGRGGRGVVVYNTPEEVAAEKRGGIIFQEFIPGEEYDVNLFRDKGGKVTASVALRKTAMKEGNVGNAVTVERADNRAAIEVSVRAAELLDLEGPLDFDIRFRENGTPALLEINARLGGNSLSATEVLDSFLGSFKELTKRRQCRKSEGG